MSTRNSQSCEIRTTTEMDIHNIRLAYELMWAKTPIGPALRSSELGLWIVPPASCRVSSELMRRELHRWAIQRGYRFDETTARYVMETACIRPLAYQIRSER